MIDNLTIFGSSLFCAAGLLWMKGPKRSEIWRNLIEGVDWLRARMEDAMLAAEFREARRAARKPKPAITVEDNGRKWEVQSR